jgi:hypothetical protein
VSEHIWITEEIDGGALGTSDFWLCSVCGASGGPVWYDHQDKPKRAPFLAGPALPLSQNCEEAKKQIAEYRQKEETMKGDTELTYEEVTALKHEAAKHAVKVLNQALDLDYSAINTLFNIRVCCNQDLAWHPTIQVVGDAFSRVGILGILNGLFGIQQDGMGLITAIWGDEDQILRFEYTPDVDWEEYEDEDTTSDLQKFVEDTEYLARESVKEPKNGVVTNRLVEIKETSSDTNSRPKLNT